MIWGSISATKKREPLYNKRWILPRIGTKPHFKISISNLQGEKMLSFHPSLHKSYAINYASFWHNVEYNPAELINFSVQGAT